MWLLGIAGRKDTRLERFFFRTRASISFLYRISPSYRVGPTISREACTCPSPRCAIASTIVSTDLIGDMRPTVTIFGAVRSITATEDSEKLDVSIPCPTTTIFSLFAEMLPRADVAILCTRCVARRSVKEFCRCTYQRTTLFLHKRHKSPPSNTYSGFM